MKVKYKGYDLIAENKGRWIFFAVIRLSDGIVVESNWVAKSYQLDKVRDTITQLKGLVDRANDQWENYIDFRKWVASISRRYAIIGSADGPMMLKSK